MNFSVCSSLSTYLSIWNNALQLEVCFFFTGRGSLKKKKKKKETFKLEKKLSFVFQCRK